MSTQRKYKSDASEAVHSTVAGMYRIGTVDQATMAEFDAMCLAVPESLEPVQIRKQTRKL